MASRYVPDSVLIHSGLDITYADPVFCSLIGVDSEAELLGLPLTDLVTEEHHAELREQVARIENEDIPALGLAAELEMVVDHSQRVILLSSLVMWDGTQQVQTLVFPLYETDSPTGRLLRERAMDEAPIGITISDPSQSDNPLIYVNDGFCELTGYPREEILGQNCRFLQGTETRVEPVAQMRAAIDAEEPVTVDLRNYRKNGSMFWNRVTIVPIRSETGDVTNFLGYQQDVTAEYRFKQNLTLFKEQADGSHKSILITDPDGTIQYVNPAFEQITGYTATEAIGRTPRILKSGQQSDEFYATLWGQITAGEVWESELTNKTKDGELYEVSQKIIPVTDEYGDITQFVAIEEDMTDHVLTTQTLAVLDRVLRHNLRNALNVIDGHAELLADVELTADARQTSIRAIRDQTSALQKIAEHTSNIREIWDPTKDKQTWDQFDLTSYIDIYERQYPNATIYGQITDEPFHVRNAKLFALALDETVKNAINHADEEPPEIEITVQQNAGSDQIHISVADNGPGISDFERQAIDSGKETPLAHSTGVGLWLMEWVATALGGRLTITDNEPKGSAVTFELPYLTPSDNG